MKNKNIIIILIILLAIIVIGLIEFLVLVLSGKVNMFGGFKSLGRRDTNIIWDESYKKEDIQNIDISSSAGDITIERSTDDTIRVVVYGQDSSDAKVDLAENKLKIDNLEYTKNWSFFNSYVKDIIVYIPSDYSNEINIKNNYGDCKVIDLENSTIDIDADCGDITLGKIKNVTIKSAYGDVNINNVLDKVEIESDCGDIKIDNLQLKENSSIKSDYGDVKIKQINDVYIDASVDLGDVKIKNNNRLSEITLKIESDCGDVKVGE